MKRRDARESAFLLIFESLFREESMQEIIDMACESRALKLDDYSKQLVLTVEEHSEEIDSGIEKYLSKWKISRLPKVTLAVLRLAVGELAYFPDIPIKVTINEAIELAKKYACEDDSAYINGVLGSYVRDEKPVKNEKAEDTQ